jgi:hypothetical protein
MPQHIESQMVEKGYEKVKGMAILNDIAVTETHREILSPKLSTQQAVDVFNNEFCDGWQLYRLSTRKEVKMSNEKLNRRQNEGKSYEY